MYQNFLRIFKAARTFSLKYRDLEIKYAKAPIEIQYQSKPNKMPICCVFSDIPDSTELWELSEGLMAPAHATYYRIMRDAMPLFNGYEVKNLGDGFFLTFPDANKALSYCIAVQKALASQRWPREIVSFRAKKDRQNPVSVIRGQRTTTGESLYPEKGLTTRLGIHFGMPFESKNDDKSGRMDHHGNMVNNAARVMAECSGDEIAFTDAVLLNLQEGMGIGVVAAGGRRILDRHLAVTMFMASIGETGFQVSRTGYVKLRGIANQQFVTMLRLRRQA